MKVYIYTIPKAGTYFIAEFLERLGFNNTGFHINQKRFLDTKKFGLVENARTPSLAMVEQPFMKTIRSMKDNDLAFGHFPLPLMAWLNPQFQFVCAYRHPRKTLVSEFVDFRFRRSDVPWISREKVTDDREAFTLFLEKHGANHATIFSQMLAISMLVSEPLCTMFPESKFHFLNFDRLISNSGIAVELAQSLGVWTDNIEEIHAATLLAETKTKAGDIEFDRDAIWSVASEEKYAQFQFEDYVQRGQDFGWTF